MDEQIEQMMRTLKLGGLAKEWRSVEYMNPEQYVTDLLMVEMREREANRINRMVKTAGFQVLKTLDDFEWKSDLELLLEFHNSFLHIRHIQEAHRLLSYSQILALFYRNTISPPSLLDVAPALSRIPKAQIHPEPPLTAFCKSFLFQLPKNQIGLLFGRVLQRLCLHQHPYKELFLCGSYNPFHICCI